MSNNGNIQASKLQTWQIVVIGLTLVFSAAFAYGFYIKSSQNQTTDDGDIDYKSWRKTSVDSLFESAKVEENKTIVIREYVPPTPEEIEEEEKAKQPTLTASQAFLPLDSKPAPKPVEKAKVDYSAFYHTQAQIIASRRSGGGDFTPLFTDKSEKPIDKSDPNTGKITTLSSTPSIDKSKPHDEDFRAHKMPKDTSTLPVDLTRTITTDRYIPCILVDQIHSQLSGQVVCQVENNVYGYHGRFILIPAGSRVVGQYQSITKVGFERFELNWKRIIRPDGAHIALSDAYASDEIGQTGLSGHIDNRMFDKYGAAIVTATMSTLMQVAMSTSYENSDITNSVVDNFGTDLGQVTAAMLADTVNLKPYAIVKSGTRLFIRPQTDIWLKESDKGQLVFAQTGTK
ncbi:TrbI/VirB10 family protein [Vibrio scophthalmi]|uniref:Uncharacterized protein n=1 Tax=Vibrio scophthalmi TaxID=45658 RepID=A0A1E3WIW2_9VIBR|nr:TrbI/VirB10 family protein [Vibrio scophthalmi]ODS09703.1 hypothetical protein VSF3289_03266 [Vibrio scophthalmi]